MIDAKVGQQRFAGQTAIVTGAGSGIGLATAVLFASEGARVVAADISEQRLADLTAQFPDLDVVAVAADITLPGDIDRIIAAADGRIDILANVAGIMDGFLPAGEVDDATWDRVFAVNTTATLRLIRAVLPAMVEAGSGAIVNVASEAGLRGSTAGVAYTASKHAVVGITKSTAFTYGPLGIRTNATTPGPVRTNVDGTPRSELGASRIFALFGALGVPIAEAAEQAAVIAFLASDAASNINGIVLPVDGGWSAI